MDISFQETGVVKQKEDIIIRRGIVHILDATLGYPVYSEQELDLTPDINDFFRSHIFKLMSGDDMKNVIFQRKKILRCMTLLKNLVKMISLRAVNV